MGQRTSNLWWYSWRRPITQIENLAGMTINLSPSPQHQPWRNSGGSRRLAKGPEGPRRVAVARRATKALRVLIDLNNSRCNQHCL
jgi:hypothetical protein